MVVIYFLILVFVRAVKKLIALTFKIIIMSSKSYESLIEEYRDLTNKIKGFDLQDTANRGFAVGKSQEDMQLLTEELSEALVATGADIKELADCLHDLNSQSRLVGEYTNLITPLKGATKKRRYNRNRNNKYTRRSWLL